MAARTKGWLNPRPLSLQGSDSQPLREILASLENYLTPEEGTRTIIFTASGALTVGIFASRLHLPFAGTVIGVRANVNLAPTSTATFNLWKNGAAVFAANKPQVLAAAFVDSTFRAPNTTTFTTADYFQVQVEASGDATGLLLAINVREG